MKLAWAAEVVKAIGDVGILLDFEEREAGADRMDCAGGRVEAVSRFHLPPVDQLDDASVEGGSAHSVSRDRFLEPDADFRARLCLEDQPGFVFPALVAGKPRRCVARVDLHRQMLRREKILHEKCVVRLVIGALEPDFAQRAVSRGRAELRRDVGLAPGLGDAMFLQSGQHWDALCPLLASGLQVPAIWLQVVGVEGE